VPKSSAELKLLETAAYSQVFQTNSAKRVVQFTVLAEHGSENQQASRLLKIFLVIATVFPAFAELTDWLLNPADLAAL
jgi:hypothetical protein